MIAPHFENTERPDPIQERVGLGMFTDREQELASLYGMGRVGGPESWTQSGLGLPSAVRQDGDYGTAL